MRAEVQVRQFLAFMQEGAQTNQDAGMALEEPSEEVQRDRHEGITMGPTTSGRGPWAPDGLQGQQLRKYFAGQLMQPEWMSDIPPDLATDW